MPRPLGRVQTSLLRSMLRSYERNHSSRSWHAGCGWVWSTEKETAKVMESLHRRGLVDKTVTHVEASPLRQGRAYDRVVYSINEAGREAAQQAN